MSTAHIIIAVVFGPPLALIIVCTILRNLMLVWGAILGAAMLYGLAQLPPLVALIVILVAALVAALSFIGSRNNGPH